MSLRYAIWYEPTGNLYEELQTIINDLAKKYSSPVFNPHITLLPGGCAFEKDAAINKIRGIADTTLPFETKFDGFGYQDTVFQSLFLKLEVSPEFQELTHRVQQKYNGSVNFDFVPHLAIVYKQLPVAEKEQIITSLGGALLQQSFVLENIDVIEYELGKPPETWKKVASIPVK